MEFRKLFGLKKNKASEESREELLTSVMKIKEGDKKLREEFIAQYRPFIRSVIISALGKQIDIEKSDEFSIGMEAFNDAINKYNPCLNSSFKNFAEQAIKWKIYEYKKGQSRKVKEYPFACFENEKEQRFEETLINTNSFQGFENVESIEEILLFERRLLDFGISIMDLTNSSPKHQDTLRLCISISKVLAEDEELFNKMIKNKSIPRNELLKKVNVHRRTIENHRKLIIAISLIFRSELDNSKMCLNYMAREGRV